MSITRISYFHARSPCERRKSPAPATIVPSESECPPLWVPDISKNVLGEFAAENNSVPFSKPMTSSSGLCMTRTLSRTFERRSMLRKRYFNKMSVGRNQNRSAAMASIEANVDSSTRAHTSRFSATYAAGAPQSDLPQMTIFFGSTPLDTR